MHKCYSTSSFQLVFEGKARPATQGPVPTEDRPYTVSGLSIDCELLMGQMIGLDAGYTSFGRFEEETISNSISWFG